MGHTAPSRTTTRRAPTGSTTSALKRVTVVELDPFERHQLFHNDQPTSQDVPLVGCWSDVDGNLYSGAYHPQPFRSIVLVKEDDLRACPFGMGGTLVVNATNEVPFAYLNPVERGWRSIELPDGDSPPCAP